MHLFAHASVTDCVCESFEVHELFEVHEQFETCLEIGRLAPQDSLQVV